MLAINLEMTSSETLTHWVHWITIRNLLTKLVNSLATSMGDTVSLFHARSNDLIQLIYSMSKVNYFISMKRWYNWTKQWAKNFEIANARTNARTSTLTTAL